MVVRRRETNCTPLLFAAILAFAALLAVPTVHAATWPTPTEGDYTIGNFRFVSGEALADLKLHYRTLGTIHKDKKGHVDNAVLIMTETATSDATPRRRLTALRLLLPYFLPYRPLLVAWLAFLALSSAATLSLPIAVRIMLSTCTTWSVFV